MKISAKHKYVYVSIPRAASTTIFSVLDEHYDVSETILSHAKYSPESAKRFFHFTVVRNPYTRAISIWYFLMQRCGVRLGHAKGRGAPRNDPAAFLKWLYNQSDITYLQWTCPAMRYQWQQLEGTRVKHKLRLETLEEGWKTLPFYNGEPKEWPRCNDSGNVPEFDQDKDHGGKKTKVRNVRPHPPEKYLTPKTKRIIRKIFDRDFRELEYPKD